MNLEEYASRKANLLQRMLRALVWVFQQFLTPGITRERWVQMLRIIYRILKPFRDEGTELARQFYDANRAEHSNANTRHDIFKDDYYPIEWMAEALQPTYNRFIRTNNIDDALVDISSRVTKVLEDGARRTLIQGVQNDITQETRGWARFDPRPPTCAFCTMMISRGPVYVDAMNAGLDIDNTSAEELMQNVDPNRIDDDSLEDIYALMNRWHPACTCIVVPVYKRAGYPTERQERDALAIYNRARRLSEKKDFKSILKTMRRLNYVPQENEDEITLPLAI